LATGANDTPLGTPISNSPVPPPTPKAQTTLEVNINVQKAPEALEATSDNLDVGDRKKKSKKRKSAADKEPV
jgi:hypothetical protein